MSQLYAVKWTKTASSDLHGIVAYLLPHSRSGAESVLTQIKNQALELGQFPELGRVVPELHSQGVFHYRELIISHWRLIYKIAGETVFVLAVLDARRNLEDLLLQRLLGSTI